MRDDYESLEFKGYRATELPNSLTPLNPSLEEAITTRVVLKVRYTLL